MKPAPFSYHRPENKAEALAMLGALDNAKLLAGGQSLMPMLNMRYAFVDHLIDINRVTELAGISVLNGDLAVGAMTRQRDLLADPGVRSKAPVIAEALSFVGHLQTRNRGTVGGSLAHMDPAAELLGLASLLDATVRVESDRGARELSIRDFPMSFMTPNMAPDEMITSVTFRMPSPGHGWSFLEFAQRHGDFAVVGAGVVLEPSTGGDIAAARISLIGVGAGPMRVSEAETLLQGQAPTEDLFRAAAEATVNLDFIGDALASSAYRKRLAKVLTRRALAEASARMAA